MSYLSWALVFVFCAYIGLGIWNWLSHRDRGIMFPLKDFAHWLKNVVVIIWVFSMVLGGSYLARVISDGMIESEVDINGFVPGLILLMVLLTVFILPISVGIWLCRKRYPKMSSQELGWVKDDNDDWRAKMARANSWIRRKSTTTIMGFGGSK